jgi:hypothetical protein
MLAENASDRQFGAVCLIHWIIAIAVPHWKPGPRFL